MKKLMIAAAIVCAAVVTQAATAVWNFQTTSKETILAPTGDTWTGTKAYAFMVSDTFTQENVYNAFFAETPKALADITGTDKFELTANGAGEIKKTNNKGLNSTVPAIEGTRQFFLALDDGNGNLFITGTTDGYSVTDMSTGATAVFPVDTPSANKIATHTGFTTGGWYMAQDVPEPTSGLLLLLGVAGLALKRKRA